MQFKVPQFLDIEDKIFGPFTFRQFVYLAGGGGLCFIIYKLLGLFWGILPIIIVAGFSLALTFYRPNNKPFIYMLGAMFKYLMGDKLYVWDREKMTTARREAPIKTQVRSEAGYSPQKLTGSKLHDLAWSLDVLDLNKKKDTERI